LEREKQLGCLGGSVVIVVAGLIFWNDWTVGIRPGREAYRAVRAIEVGVSWPDAVVAAERSLPVGRMFVGHCRLADGQYAYFGRWRSGFMTQLPEESRTFPSRDLWRLGIWQQLAEPRLCRSLRVSVNRDYDFDVAVDEDGRVTKVTEIPAGR
jgi:hypothetical protein